MAKRHIDSAWRLPGRLRPAGVARAPSATSRSPTLIGSKRQLRDTRHFDSPVHLVGVAQPEVTRPEPAAGPDAVSQGPRSKLADSGGAGRPSARHLAAARWPLLTVLAVQFVLSLRLIWSNTAFQDEALYLRAGHLEWARWLHHTPIPNFPAYFSGAPVLYPPLGAVADSVGGLAAARSLSLCLMLGVTSLLWATTVRLYGQRAALLAAALFGTLAGTQFLGALATFDTSALFLLSAATWLAVRSASCQARTRVALLLTAAATLGAADAVKYATVLFTPAVLAVAAFAAWRQRGGRAGLMALLAVLCPWLVLISAAMVAGGRNYWLGITASTLSRPAAHVPVTTVLRSAYIWTSLILVLAILGAILASRSKERGRFLPAILAAAALLAPAGQAGLGTTVSLQKHVVFGAWFAAIAAGYAMARLSRVDPGHGWAAVMALPIAAATLFGSMGQATALHNAWPNADAVINVLRTTIRAHPGHYLAEDYDVEAYYLRDLRAEAPWPRWSSTYSFSYGQALPGAPSYLAAIDKHYFSLVILDFGDTAATDNQIVADMRQAGGYYVLARAGWFTVWATQASARPAGGT